MMMTKADLKQRCARMAMDMARAEQTARTWLHATCPHVWTLLNQRARRTLPPGLVAYLTTGNVARSRQHLAFADAEVAALIGVSGPREVGNTYRRHLSQITTEAQLTQHLCELSVAAALGRLAGAITLRPPTGRGGTRSDFAVRLAGVPVYGEVKRLEDPFLLDGAGVWRVRSLVKAPPGATIPPDTARPRPMDLVSKLRDVPRQFPDGTVNVLFVYHPSFGDSHRYMQAALFGDATWFANPEELGEPAADGLFALEAWRRVSACYLAHVSPEHGFYCAPRWPNPRAWVALPLAVRRALDALDPPPA